MPVIEHSAAPIYLRDLMTARTLMEPNVRARYQGLPTITISADIRPGSHLSAAMVQKKTLHLAERIARDIPGVSICFGGEFESTSKSYVSERGGNQ